VQHDGRDCRCLVARACGGRPDAIFQRIRRRKFFGADDPRLTLRANRKRQFVPPPDAWLHEPCAGNTGFGLAIPTSALLGEISSFQTMTSFVGISE
jgi:hypothetical protein